MSFLLDSISSAIFDRLLVICLLDNDLVCQMTREFAGNCHFEDLSHEQVKKTISATSQLITSIPDKARREAPASLTPRYPYFEFRMQSFLYLHKSLDETLKTHYAFFYHQNNCSLKIYDLAVKLK